MFHGVPWTTVELHGMPRRPVAHTHGYPTEVFGAPWYSMELLWVSVGFPLVSMEVGIFFPLFLSFGVGLCDDVTGLVERRDRDVCGYPGCLDCVPASWKTPSMWNDY